MRSAFVTILAGAALVIGQVSFFGQSHFLHSYTNVVLLACVGASLYMRTPRSIAFILITGFLLDILTGTTLGIIAFGLFASTLIFSQALFLFIRKKQYTFIFASCISPFILFLIIKAIEMLFNWIGHSTLTLSLSPRSFSIVAGMMLGNLIISIIITLGVTAIRSFVQKKFLFTR